VGDAAHKKYRGGFHESAVLGVAFRDGCDSGFELRFLSRYLIVGNDEKLLWDDKGATVLHPAGKDSVVILDLAKPENPKVIATLPLKNSVVGPPVNLAIDPTNSIAFNAANNLALVTNRVDKSVSVLSVKGTDVKVIDTIDLGGIVSHAVFTPDGKHALVSKLNDHKVSLLDVKDDKVTYNKLDLPTGQ
jgi:WD40 repeat protein